MTNTTKTLEEIKKDARIRWGIEVGPNSNQRQQERALCEAIETAYCGGIQASRSVLRSSQENCMCNEKNHSQLDRLLDSLKDPQG